MERWHTEERRCESHRWLTWKCATNAMRFARGEDARMRRRPAACDGMPAPMRDVAEWDGSISPARKSARACGDSSLARGAARAGPEAGGRFKRPKLIDNRDRLVRPRRQQMKDDACGQQRLLSEQHAVTAAVRRILRATVLGGISGIHRAMRTIRAHHGVRRRCRCRQDARHQRCHDQKRDGQPCQPRDGLSLGLTSQHAADRKIIGTEAAM